MSERTVLYDVLESKVGAMAASFNDSEPYHKFSRNYLRKENMIRRAYISSKGKNNGLDQEYHRIRLRNRIIIVVLIVAAILCIAGFTIYITHYIGSMRIEEYNNHSLASVIETRNANDTIERSYLITYDLSGWNKEIINDDEFYYWEIYRKDEAYISFKYRVKKSYQDILLNTEDSEIEERVIGNNEVIYFVSNSGVESIHWVNENYIFSLLYKGIDYDKVREIIESISEP